MNKLLLAQRISLERRRLNWSQKQLADRVGVTQSATSKWERGVTTPSIEQVEAMARAFEVPVLYLIVGSARLLNEDPRDHLLELCWYGLSDLLPPNKAVWAVRPVEEVLVCALETPTPRAINRLPTLFFRHRGMSAALLEAHARVRKVEQRLGWIAAVTEALAGAGMGMNTPALRELSLEPDLEAPWDSLGVPAAETLNLPPFSKRWRVSYDQSLQGFQEAVEPLVRVG